ncbi:hypothetical protein AACH10_12370 [Ideonella sp. DXS22W]|uniref:Lipoprotein n=1 Tax=Pseudaquabacterium inlustre TaxID=2984192 RepID=A0ABU9CH23_9BURK
MQRRIFIALGLAGLAALSGCETTGSIDRHAAPETLKGAGWVLFSVTHERDMTAIARRAGNVTLFVDMRDLDRQQDLQRAFSTQLATLSPVIESSFDDLWGRVFVRELPPGRYAFTQWTVFQNYVYFTRSYSPQPAPPPLTFEVQAGSVTYLGNLHGHLNWTRNALGVDMLSSAEVTVRHEADRDLAAIFKSYPQLRGKVDVKPLPAMRWASPD